MIKPSEQEAPFIDTIWIAIQLDGRSVWGQWFASELEAKCFGKPVRYVRAREQPAGDGMTVDNMNREELRDEVTRLRERERLLVAALNGIMCNSDDECAVDVAHAAIGK